MVTRPCPRHSPGGPGGAPRDHAMDATRRHPRRARLARWSGRGDQPAEQGGLARPGAATGEEGALAGHHGHENRGPSPHRPCPAGRDRRPRPAPPAGCADSHGRHPAPRGQHGVQAYAAGQVDVGPWLGIVEAASTEPRQSDRQWSQLPCAILTPASSIPCPRSIQTRPSPLTGTSVTVGSERATVRSPKPSRSRVSRAPRGRRRLDPGGGRRCRRRR